VTSSSLCTFDTSDQCVSRTFNALFTPDVQLWPAYKQNATNPGQFFYNLIAAGDAGDVRTVDITIPWPFITVGSQPVHVYDAEDVQITDTNGVTCFIPANSIASYDTTITLADWANGTNSAPLACDKVDGPAGSGFCTLSLAVPIPPSGQAYVNVHLDYGFKGPNVDANLVDDIVDRYDRGTQDGAGYDALVNNSTGNGALAIDNCTEYAFSHDDGSNQDSDSVFNLNIFKKIAGAFGLVQNASTGELIAGLTAKLYNSAGQVVKIGVTDKDGFYTLEYAHKGKPALYNVCLSGSFNKCQVVELRANGWSEVTFDVGTGTVIVSVK
jgi:hypothetical protein